MQKIVRQIAAEIRITEQQVKASGHEISVYESAAVFTSRQCPCKHGSHDTQPHASMT